MSLRIWCDDCEEHYFASDLNTVILVSSTTDPTQNRLFTLSTWCPKPKCNQQQAVFIREKSTARTDVERQLLKELLESRERATEKVILPDLQGEPPPGITPSAQTMTEILQEEGCAADKHNEGPPGPTPSRTPPFGPQPEKKY